MVAAVGVAADFKRYPASLWRSRDRPATRDGKVIIQKHLCALPQEHIVFKLGLHSAGILQPCQIRSNRAANQHILLKSHIQSVEIKQLLQNRLKALSKSMAVKIGVVYYRLGKESKEGR